MKTLTKTEAVKHTAPTDAVKPADGSGPFYPQLNGLRFVFVMMVMLHHWAPQTLTERFRIGWTGVDLFYVLSGFLIGEILLKERDKTENKGLSIRNFIIRRALRIFPLYYTVVLLYSFLVTDGGMLLYNLTYTNNFVQAYQLDRVPEDFWHLWSLCVEEQFYLVFPFLVFFVNRRLFPVLLISGIVFSVVGRVCSTWFATMPDNHVLMPFCLDSLFGGVLLAWLKLYRPAFLQNLLGSQSKALAWVAVSIGVLLVVCYVNNTVGVYGFLRLFGSIGGFFLIGYAAVKEFKGPLKRFFENRYVALLGKISYGIYLYHSFVERLWYRTALQNPVRNFFIDLHKPVISNRYVIDFFFLFTITVIVSYLSFFYFEKRFLKLKTLFT